MDVIYDRLPGWLFLAAMAAGLAATAWRARLWLAGRPARVDVVGGLLALPRRYLVDVHEVMARSRSAARMHVPAAGGFVAALVLMLLVHVFHVGGVWLAWVLLAVLAVAMVGFAMAARRRRKGANGHLSEAPHARLGSSLAFILIVVGYLTFRLTGAVALKGEGIWPVFAAFAMFLCATTPPTEHRANSRKVILPTLAVWFVAVLVTIVFGDFGVALVFVATVTVLARAAWPALRHAVHGALHLAFHPRPRRFGGGRDVALAPLDLDAPKLGMETPRDFPWNRLLGFDACVQCGRCEAVCPAFAAGQPLNPKKLIQDLVVGLSAASGSDIDYTGNTHPGQAIGAARGGWATPVIGDLVNADTLWACTTCRHCVHECPMMIEHVDAVIDLRRFQTLEAGAVPPKAAAALDHLRLADNPGGRDPATRLDWAVDLGLRALGPGDACSTLLWLGDAAFDLRGQRTLRALIALLRQAGEDVAVLAAEPDCGDLARRLGDEATFQTQARRVIAALGAVRYERIVTADPHALNSLRNDYPAFGGRFAVAHHSQVLADLLGGGRLRVARPLAGRVTYHDPCYLGRYNGEIAAPRAVLAALGAELVEMERSGLRSTCCGGGGGAALTDVAGRVRVPDVRMDMIRETGAPVVAVACPNCALMLEGVTGARPRVADLAELTLEATA
jgi:Fe-S oxidoreductase